MNSVIEITYFELVPNTLFFTIPINHERVSAKYETKKRDYIELKNEIVKGKLEALTRLIGSYRKGMLEIREINGVQRLVIPTNIDATDIEQITKAMKELVSDEISLIERKL